MMKFVGFKTFAGLALAFGTMSWAVPASAQATRTWVSGVGDDANPCSRTAPCKTFAGAISKTATGGEINCLDPGGFGGVTIIKSISIVCDFTEGGVLSAGAGVNGIVINLPSATDTVFLSGLDLNGAGNAQNGIRIVSGGVVHIQNSIIRNYRASNGLGMSVQPAGSLQLTVFNTTIDDNGVSGNPGTGGGILVQPTGAGGAARVTLRDVRLQNNGNNQIRIDTTGNTGAGVTVDVFGTEISGGANGISVNVPTSNAQMNIFDTLIRGATQNGITVTGASATIRVGRTTITSNATGLASAGGAFLLSYANNTLDGNGVSGSFTQTIPLF